MTALKGLTDVISGAVWGQIDPDLGADMADLGADTNVPPAPASAPTFMQGRKLLEIKGQIGAATVPTRYCLYLIITERSKKDQERRKIG